MYLTDFSNYQGKAIRSPNVHSKLVLFKVLSLWLCFGSPSRITGLVMQGGDREGISVEAEVIILSPGATAAQKPLVGSARH